MNGQINECHNMFVSPLKRCFLSFIGNWNPMKYLGSQPTFLLTPSGKPKDKQPIRSTWWSFELSRYLLLYLAFSKTDKQKKSTYHFGPASYKPYRI